MMTDSVTDHNALHNIAFNRGSLELYHQLNQAAQVVEYQAKDLEVRGSNPGPGLNFCLEFK